jgi:hypothetical protein
MARFLLFLSFAVCYSFTAVAQSPYLCRGDTDYFANCTEAPCPSTEGNNGLCKCRVQQPKPSLPFSVSTTTAKCVNSTETTVQSRYYPIQYYQSCSPTSARAWANCLGASCTWDQKHPERPATCKCPITYGQPFIIALSKPSYKPLSCTQDMYSSATLLESQGMTKFLQGNFPMLAGPVYVPPK